MTLEAIKSTTPLRAPKQKPFRRYATERAIARNAERHLRADRGRGATLQEIKAGIDLQAAKARASQEARLSDYLHGRRNVTAPILKAIGYERVTIYRKKEPAPQEMK